MEYAVQWIHKYNQISTMIFQLNYGSCAHKNYLLLHCGKSSLQKAANSNIAASTSPLKQCWCESEGTLPHICCLPSQSERPLKRRCVPASLAISMCVDDDSGSWLGGMCKFMWPRTATIYHRHSYSLTRKEKKGHSESASHSHSLTAQGKEASLQN